MKNLAKIMNQISAQLAADQIADGNGKKSIAHVSALLPGRRQSGDIFVISSRLSDFAKRQDEKRRDHETRAGVQQQDEPGKAGIRMPRVMAVNAGILRVR